MRKKFLHLRLGDTGSGVRYPTDTKSAGFRSWLEASRNLATLKICDTMKQSVC